MSALVEIYPYGDPTRECEGVAELIEKISESGNRQTWLVRFKDEHRLMKRVIRVEVEESQPNPVPKMEKRIVNGKVKYFYKKSLVGLDRPSYSEIKYQYKRARRKNSKS